MGFTTSTIVVKRKERFAGETSYTFIKKLSAALDITIAYSDKPLKISVVGGLAISGISVIIGSIILLLKFVGLIEVSGWAGVMFSLYLLGGLIIANLGVIGYYLSKTFDETKRRPLYIVETVTQDISI
jgi:dolichol-phosphate mannosyltransferase